MVDQLKTSCGECSSEMIDNQFFVCYPESPSFVTYRARLEGTRETDSDSLISLIEEWVRGGVSLIVTGVLMTVDPHCSVAISSPDQPECSLATSSSSTVPVSDAVIGGVVAVVIVITITIAVIIIVFLILKNHHGEVSLKRYKKKYECGTLTINCIDEKIKGHSKFFVVFFLCCDFT